MTSKRFSFKNLIFVFTLLMLAIAFCVAGGNGIVLADSRSDAKTDINNSYTAIVSRTYGSDVLVDENNYNAQKVLDKIKASADYLLDNCQEGQIDSIKLEKLEELAIVNDFISIGESLKEYTYDLLGSKTYTDWNKDLVQGYLDSFLSLLNIDKLFNAGNLNRGYLQNTIGDETKGEYKVAKSKIDGVAPEQGQTTDIGALKTRALNLMEDALNSYISSGYYDDIASRELQYDNNDPSNLGAKQKINNATLEGEINIIRSEFITSLHSSKTITEKVYDTYIYYSTYPDINSDGNADYTPNDISDSDLINAILVYNKIKQDGTSSFIDSSKFSYVSKAGTKVFDVYRTRKLEELAKPFYNPENNPDYIRYQYSDTNLVKIVEIIYNAKLQLQLSELDLNGDLAGQVDSIITNAKDAIAQVPTNVSTVQTIWIGEDEANLTEDQKVLTKSKYKITITSSNPYAFSPDAFVVANDYDFYPVKVNVNRLLKKLEPTKDANGKTQGLTVKFYININVYDKYIIQGPNLDIDDFDIFASDSTFMAEQYKDASKKYQAPTDKDGNYTETYTVTIVMDENFQKAVGEDVKVIYYYNGQMEELKEDDGKYTLDQTGRNVKIEENSQGEKVLMFTTNHFSPYAICANATIGKLFAGPFYTNPFFYIAAILLVIIFIIVLAIVLKHCKYKLIFVNNGGTRVKTRKFKNKELIEMPLENPTKKGFVFGGWFADKACTDRFVQTVMTRKKVKAYAKWNPITSTCVDDYYKELRAYLDDFQKVGTGVSFAEEDKVARIIISNDKVLLFVAGDFAKYQEMGYKVTEDKHPDNQGISTKFIVKTEEDLEKALELIDMAMDKMGLMEKEDDLVIKDITEEERANGYLLSIKNDKVATDLKDFFEMLRVECKSYVMMGDGGTPRDLNGKFIVKAKKYADSIKLYLPYEAEGAEKVTDVLYKDVPYMYQVTDAESCEKALKVIADSMISIGMTKYPRNASLMKGAGDEDTAFGYKIKFN